MEKTKIEIIKEDYVNLQNAKAPDKLKLINLAVQLRDIDNPKCNTEDR